MYEGVGVWPWYCRGGNVDQLSREHHRRGQLPVVLFADGGWYGALWPGV